MSKNDETDDAPDSNRRLLLGAVAFTATVAPLSIAAPAIAADLIRPSQARIVIRNLASESIKDLAQASRILRKIGSQVRILNQSASERLIGENEAIVNLSYVLGVRG